MSFDGINKRLYLYTFPGKITSYDLDGSNPTEININIVEETFAVDGRNSLIYYHHKFSERIYVYNITSGQDIEVAGASSITGVKDLEVDARNG